MFDLTTHFIYGYMTSDKCFTLRDRSDDPSPHKWTFYHSYVSPFVFGELSHVYTATNREGSTRVEHGSAKKVAV